MCTYGLTSPQNSVLSIGKGLKFAEGLPQRTSNFFALIDVGMENQVLMEIALAEHNPGRANNSVSAINKTTCSIHGSQNPPKRYQDLKITI